MNFFKQKDKQKHIIYSFSITIVIFILSLYAEKIEYLHSLLYAGCITLIIGVSKEVYDHFRPKHHIVGILIALGILYAVS